MSEVESMSIEAASALDFNDEPAASPVFDPGTIESDQPPALESALSVEQAADLMVDDAKPSEKPLAFHNGQSPIHGSKGKNCHGRCHRDDPGR